MVAPGNELVPLVFVGERAAYLHSGMPRVGSARDVLADAARLEADEHPRWAVPSAAASLRALVDAGVGPARSWDLAEGHRILHGGWAAGPGLVHAVPVSYTHLTLPTNREV